MRCSLLLSLVCLAACESVPRCVEGTTQACACPGGRSGVQTCTAEGRFAACLCDDALLDGGGGGIDAVALPSCNPLTPDCAANEGCYSVGAGFVCAPDASLGGGAYGAPCANPNVCAPGLVCLTSSVFPPGLPCEGSTGCCSPYCDLSDPRGDMQCPGAAEGQVCTPWFEAGMAPPGYENLGACARPEP